ncbi:hypothetical protein HOH87_01005 [bacterium]|jgi:SEC-C motif domain protein|nr:hypothetical protein [bacterium]
MNSKKIQKECPCQSGQIYQSCCGPFLMKIATPLTPEQLMRSRYTAFAKVDIDYIQATMTGLALEGFNYDDLKVWAASIEWVGLQIISTSTQSDTGEVVFVASYLDNGVAGKLQEKSQFVNRGGTWFYYDGDVRFDT